MNFLRDTFIYESYARLLLEFRLQDLDFYDARYFYHDTGSLMS